MTATAPASTAAGTRALRKLTSRRATTARASSRASSARAWMSAAEPRISGASALASSSTVEEIRSFSSGWRRSMARAMPRSVKLRAIGRRSVNTPARPAAATHMAVSA